MLEIIKVDIQVQPTRSKVLIVTVFLGLFAPLKAQVSEDDSLNIKSQALPDVEITAHHTQRRYFSAPAAIAVVQGSPVLESGQSGMVNAINLLPGVQLEERSPGSYRLNLRGSSMRAPFGVRNVKVYYNGLPFTEPGGTTYLNQLTFQKYDRAEFIKGPSSSSYGAGNGGVVLLNDTAKHDDFIHASSAASSYGGHDTAGEFNTIIGKINLNGFAAYQVSDGYREQSFSRRNLFSMAGTYRPNPHHQIELTFLHGFLRYGTPGGLTLQQYGQNPKSARPTAGEIPSAVDARARIEQRTTWAGLNYQSDFSENFKQTTGVYAAQTDLVNASIRNFSDSKIPHFGLRSVWQWNHKLAENIQTEIFGGLEIQGGDNQSRIFENNKGEAGVLNQESSSKTTPYFFFIRNNWHYRSWEVQLSGAWHFQKTVFDIQTPRAEDFNLDYKWIFTPRVTLSNTFAERCFAYFTLSRGFSPATTDEYFPTGGVLNAQLQPETGTNLEIGLRWRLGQTGLVEVNGYLYRLSNTIIQRRDPAGGDYYLNAGATSQPGMEVNYSHRLQLSHQMGLSLRASYAYQPYRYKNFATTGGDYSGNEMAGVTRHKTGVSTALNFFKSWQMYAQYLFLDALPLNDANSVYSAAQHTLDAGLSKEIVVTNRETLNFNFGINNLTNTKYSLGYDINAFGGRYYNAAPGRNFSLRVTYHFD